MYGAESVIVNLCKWFNAGRHRSSIAVFVNHPKPIPELYEKSLELGIECHLIPATGRIDRKAVHKIRQLAVALGADLVHSHGYKADVFVHLALRRTRICYVATCHNWLDNDWASTLYGRLDRWILSKFCRVAAVSEEVERRLERAGVRSNLVELIRNGVDLRSFQVATQRPERQTHAIVGFVGRLSPEKGPDVFLQAARQVLSSQPNVEFVVAGAGPEQSALEGLSRELGITGRVRFLQYVSNMPALYQQFDLLVSASRREGLPIAILEAMASGVPVIATAVGEVPKIIDHGRTGLLAPSDCAPALAEAMLQLIQDPLKRRALSRAARQQMSEHFSLERMGADYLDFYKHAIETCEQRAKWLSNL
jgi:glycosyltransferase involved in cell wall biosynthesis